MPNAFGRNVLGGNFSLVGVPSVGASGAIFGTVAVRVYLPFAFETLKIDLLGSRSPGLTCLLTGSINIDLCAR